MKILGFLSEIFDPLRKLVDDVHTSKEEALEARGKLLEVENKIYSQVIGYERERLEQQSKIITAEAQGESWLQRNWRPMVMLFFCGLLGSYWLGFAPQYLIDNSAITEKLFTLLQIGIGGYIGGRSLEKITDKYAKGIAKQ